MKHFLFCALVAIAVVGCDGSEEDALMRSAVISQASFDYDCPRDKIRVFEISGNPYRPNVDIDVCGTKRKYRDIGHSGYVFVEVGTKLGDAQAK